MKLSVATWNIAGSGGGEDEPRLRRQMGLLASLSPSVVALQECRHWDRDYHAALHLAEELLDMRGFLAPSAHDGCHLAVFVRETAGLRVTGQRHLHGHPYWHGAARITVRPAGLPAGLQLVSIHLAPASPQIRLAEAESLSLLAKGPPAVIAGDFNALAAGDPEPPSWAEGRWRRKVDRRPAEALAEAGFTDAAAHLGNLTPTVGRAGGLPYRCDRICTTLPAAAVTACQVLTAATADSDHRPVIAELDLSQAAGFTGITAGEAS